MPKTTESIKVERRFYLGYGHKRYENIVSLLSDIGQLLRSEFVSQTFLRTKHRKGAEAYLCSNQMKDVTQQVTDEVFTHIRKWDDPTSAYPIIVEHIVKHEQYADIYATSRDHSRKPMSILRKTFDMDAGMLLLDTYPTLDDVLTIAIRFDDVEKARAFDLPDPLVRFVIDEITATKA